LNCNVLSDWCYIELTDRSSFPHRVQQQQQEAEIIARTISTNDNINTIKASTLPYPPYLNHV